MTSRSPATPNSIHPQAQDWVTGGGEMGQLIRGFDWSQTSLGPIELWPQSLRSAVSILLPSKAQIAMFWGPDLIILYNDAYRPVLGDKHPSALGLPAREVWSELWDTGLKSLFEGVLETGEAFWASDWPFNLERFGFPEETFFDISYDPIRDESGAVAGLFCIVSDTTARVISDRRLKTLRGGAFDTYFYNQATCHFQSADWAMARKHNIGFRVAISLSDLSPGDAPSSSKSEDEA